MESEFLNLGKYSLGDEIRGDQKRKKRDQLVIMVDLLEAVKEPAKKTHLLYMTKINYYQLIRYLDLLSRLGLLEATSDPFDGYIITKKGRILLTLLDGSFKIKSTLQEMRHQPVVPQNTEDEEQQLGYGQSLSPARTG